MDGSTSLALLSDRFVVSALAVYAGAFVAYCAEWSGGARDLRGRRAAATRVRAEARTPALAGAAAAGAFAVRPPHPPHPPTAPEPPPGPDKAGPGAPPDPPAPPGAPPSPATDRCGRIGVALTLLGTLLHAAGIAARGAATDRVPLGNMYEFALGGALAAVGTFLVLLARQRDRRLGLFVLLPVTLFLGLAVTVLHVEAGGVIPALRSYWLAVHVSTAVLCAGVFTLAAVASGLHLLRVRLERDGRRAGPAWEHLPGAAALDRLAGRAAAFAFPLWTFAILAGAIWAESAWGRYWAWDPKETWAFITWVAYAAYLHARATAGWRATGVAWINLAGYGCFLFNVVGVNLFVSGLHSYAGV